MYSRFLSVLKAALVEQYDWTTLTIGVNVNVHL